MTWVERGGRDEGQSGLILDGGWETYKEDEREKDDQVGENDPRSPRGNLVGDGTGAIAKRAGGAAEDGVKSGSERAHDCGWFGAMPSVKRIGGWRLAVVYQTVEQKKKKKKKRWNYFRLMA